MLFVLPRGKKREVTFDISLEKKVYPLALAIPITVPPSSEFPIWSKNPNFPTCLSLGLALTLLFAVYNLYRWLYVY